MSQRPSLLDEGDFGAIGTKQKSSGGGGPGMDKSKMIKIGVLVGVMALAALVWAWPKWLAPEPVVREKEGNIVKHETTPEELEEFERQQRQIQLDVESGKAVIGGA